MEEGAARKADGMQGCGGELRPHGEVRFAWPGGGGRRGRQKASERQRGQNEIQKGVCLLGIR